MKLKFISIFLKVCLRLLIAFTLFFVAISLASPFTGIFSEVNIPLSGLVTVEFADESMESVINANLPQASHIKIMVDDLRLAIPYSTSFEILKIISFIIISAYLCLIIKIILNIVLDIRNSRSFHVKNIKRFKNLALLFMFGPIMESILRFGVTVYISSVYELPHGITYTGGFDFHLSTFIIGLLSYAVALAFGQGLLVKEENDLTI